MYIFDLSLLSILDIMGALILCWDAVAQKVYAVSCKVRYFIHKKDPPISVYRAHDRAFIISDRALRFDILIS